MRAGCIAQDMIVLRPLQTRRGGTSTERLKTGAEQFWRLAPSSARRVVRPNGRGFHSPIRRLATHVPGAHARSHSLSLVNYACPNRKLYAIQLRKAGQLFTASSSLISAHGPSDRDASLGNAD